jgi:hypothetical protein
MPSIKIKYALAQPGVHLALDQMTLDRCGIHLYPKRWKKILENRLRCLGYWCESAVSTPRCCWKFSFVRHDRRGLIPCTGRMFKCCEDLRLHEGGTRDMIIMLTWKVWKLYDDLTHAKNYPTNQCDPTLLVKLLWNTVPNQKTDRRWKSEGQRYHMFSVLSH